MKFEFDKDLYGKDILLAAAYSFTDKAYIHLDIDENKYVVNITMKDSHREIDEKTFCNEMIAQAVRKGISEQTRNIRELILARAFSSTVINERKEIVSGEVGYSEQDIIKDWFENYE